MVGHGAVPDDSSSRPSNSNWVSGDQIYLTRVVPSTENMKEASKYQYFCGFNKRKKPIWTKDFSKIKPIFEWNNNAGCVTITYNATLEKYIMCVTDGYPTLRFMDTYFLKSSKTKGPWKIKFPTKKVECIECIVLGVGRASNIGLAEIAFFSE